MAYGTDWLAFGHLVIATAFIGPLRDPVRNKWIIDWGLIACVGVLPLALICGPLRGIPFYWRLIDCSFGFVGAIPFRIRRRDSVRDNPQKHSTLGKAGMKKYIYGCVVFPLTACFCILAYLFFELSNFDPCENDVIQQIQSPDGQSKVVIFERGCGATTSTSTQVSILPTGSDLPDEVGNIFITDSNHGAAPRGPEISAEWLNRQGLKIIYDRRAAVFTKIKRFKNVTITYKTR